MKRASWMGVTSVLLSVVMVVNIILGVSIVFLERKNASSTWAWLMVLLFIPIIGFILYLIFGKPISKGRIFVWDTKSRLGLKAAVQGQLREIEQNEFHYNDEDMKRYQSLIYLNLRTDASLLSQNNSVDILLDGKEKFDRLMQDMRRAKNHIHLIYYIVRNDELGNQIADVLIKKANEGVSVRFLYDAMGGRRLGKGYVKRLREAGVQVEEFFPAKVINFKINYRNHRKLAIIDGKVGYIGGFNIGDEYLGKKRKFGYWRDTHLRMKGSAVENMQTRFILDWNQAAKEEIHYEDDFYQSERAGDAAVQIVSSGPDQEMEQIKNGYIKMIMEAKEYVYIQTPYFIPDDSLRDALRIAALSGVDVKVMIPNKPDHPFVYWATLSYSGDLLEAGGEVYIYQNGFMHAKMLIVDGKISTVGTANIDVRSFRLNFEVNAFIYDKKITQELEEAFDQDIKRSTQMTKKLYDKRSIGIRIKESISRLLSPVL